MSELYKDFIRDTRLDDHCSLMEIFKRFCTLKAPQRGELKRYLLKELPPTQLNTETINDYIIRIKVTKSLKKYTSDKIL